MKTPMRTIIFAAARRGFNSSVFRSCRSTSLTSVGGPRSASTSSCLGPRNHTDEPDLRRTVMSYDAERTRLRFRLGIHPMTALTISMRGQFLLIPLRFRCDCRARACHRLPHRRTGATAACSPAPSLSPTTDDHARAGTRDQRASGVSVRNRTLNLWRVSTGGWFIVDQVIGRHDNIPYAIGFECGRRRSRDPTFSNTARSYGGQIREPLWRAQFIGKRQGAPLTLKRDIQNISGRLSPAVTSPTVSNASSRPMPSSLPSLSGHARCSAPP